MVAALPDDILDELRVLVNTVLLPGGGSCRAWRRRGIVPVPKPHQLFTPSAIDTGGGTYMRPPRADETDMENRRFLALSVLPFLPRYFFLSVLFVLSVCVLSCLSCFLSLCVSGPDVSCVFFCLVCPCCLVCLAFFMILCPALCLAVFVLSCLSCFFYDLMSCAVSCVFFWFVCSSSLCYRYWWHGDGTDMRTPRTDGTDMRTPFLLVTPVVTCWLHWCLLTCLLAVLAGHAGAWLLVVLSDHAAACLLVVLAGCACFLAGIGGAVKLRSSTSVCLFFFMSVSVFLVFLNNPPTPTQPNTPQPTLPHPTPPRTHTTPPPHTPTPTTHHTLPHPPLTTRHHYM